MGTASRARQRPVDIASNGGHVPAIQAMSFASTSHIASDCWIAASPASPASSARVTCRHCQNPSRNKATSNETRACAACVCRRNTNNEVRAVSIGIDNRNDRAGSSPKTADAIHAAAKMKMPHSIASRSPPRTSFPRHAVHTAPSTSSGSA
jgi:hypothetical protein